MSLKSFDTETDVNLIFVNMVAPKEAKVLHCCLMLFQVECLMITRAGKLVLPEAGKTCQNYIGETKVLPVFKSLQNGKLVNNDINHIIVIIQ